MQKDVRRLHVSMLYPQSVQCFETSRHAYKDPPDVILLKVRLSLLMVHYLLIHISILCVFHHNAESLFWFFNECFFIANHVLMLDWGEDSDLVQCVLSLLHWQWTHVDLLQCISLLVAIPHHLIHLRIGSLPYSKASSSIVLSPYPTCSELESLSLKLSEVVSEPMISHWLQLSFLNNTTTLVYIQTTACDTTRGFGVLGSLRLSSFVLYLAVPLR